MLDAETGQPLATPLTVTSVVKDSLTKVVVNDTLIMGRDVPVRVWVGGDRPSSWVLYGIYAGEPTLCFYTCWSDASDAWHSMDGAMLTSVQVARVLGIDSDPIDDTVSIWEAVDL